MHNLMDYEIVRQASRDRSNQLIREADARRLAGVARAGAPVRAHRRPIAELFARAFANRRLMDIRT